MGKCKFEFRGFVVNETDIDGFVYEQLHSFHYLYKPALQKMAQYFNKTDLKQHLNNDDSRKTLDCPLKECIKSIRMFVKESACYPPSVQIVVTTYPNTIRITKAIKNYLNNFIERQFIGECGKAFFGAPIKFPHNTFIAIEPPK